MSAHDMDHLMLFTFLMNSAQDSIFTKNTAREYTFVNAAMARLFGCMPDDLIGRKPEEIFSGEDAAVVRKVDDRTFEGHQVSERREIRVGGELKLFHTIQSPMIDDAGNVAGICGIVRDLTEFNNLQLQLIHSEKVAAVGQLAAGIAHEFNNILAIISLNAQMPLLEAANGKIELTNKTKGNLENILRTINKGKTIVSDIMSFARPKEPVKTLCSIESVIEDVIKLQEHQLDLEHIRIVRNYNDTPRVWIDRSQFEQVFFNLFVNSRHAIKPKEKGEIRIRTSVDPSAVIVTVADTGIGIEAGNMDKLFTPFFTTKGALAGNGSGVSGSGLGLPVVYAILQRHAGAIHVDSRAGDGCCVTIQIPVIHEPAGGNATEDSQSVIETSNKMMRVLLIDDDADFADAATDLLELLNCRVTWFSRGCDAVRSARVQSYDVILLDLLLPDASGEKILQDIRGFDSETPVVLISGKAGLDPGQFAGRGVTALLRKPFDVAELRTALTNASNSR